MKNNIKSLAIIIFILSFISLTASAQYKSVLLGIKAAPTISWLKTNASGYSNEGIKMGFSWGVTSEFYFAKNYALVTGLNFIYQNGKLSYPHIGDNFTRNYKIRYLEIPAVLKLKTNNMGNFRYFGQIGLGFGIRTGSKASDEYRVGGSTTSTDFRGIDGETRLFRTSMIVGAGVEYPFDNNTALVAGINFNNGFTNALKGDNAVNPYTEHDGRPNFIELSLGVMF